MTDMVEKARAIALRAHGAQRYGSEPYEAHLAAVAEICRPYGVLAEAAAWLHDALEDTELDADEIADEIADEVSGDVLRIVQLVTDEPGKNRRERKASTLVRLAAIEVPVYGTDHLALVVKAADRLANTRACKRSRPDLLEMYREEYGMFVTAVFRKGLCDEIWNELDELSQ